MKRSMSVLACRNHVPGCKIVKTFGNLPVDPLEILGVRLMFPSAGAPAQFHVMSARHARFLTCSVPLPCASF